MCALMAGMMLPAAVGWADSVYIRSSDSEGKPLEVDGITIKRVEDGRLYFDNNGNETSRGLSQIQQIAIDGEDALNAAETAYAGRDYAGAVDGYLKTFRSPSRPWLREWVVTRLVESANKSGRFDAGAAGYAYLLETDGATAQKYRPTFPDGSSQYLVSAAADVQADVDQANLSDAQKTALLGFLVDIQTARNDKAAADAAGEQLDELLAKDPGNPGAQRALARRKLVAAGRALDEKNWAAAEAIIDQVRGQLNDPAQQDEALWIVASARYGALGNGKDADSLKDAGLGYMRIVADFKDLPGRPHVVAALIKTAQIERRLGDVESAREIYRQVVQQYGDDPESGVARQELEQLSKS
jgi:hypothetical protein